jgi:predicted nucleotidyltransferase
MGELLNRSRQDTATRIEELRAKLADAEGLCGDKACVYATGSFGRREASRHSDLDLFIVGEGSRKDPKLSPLDEILLKADLIKATRELTLPEFSGGGQYLVGHTVSELVDTLGSPEDDAENTFTARLLLLLESFPLLGKPAYDQITNKVVRAYWRDYKGHERDFIPAFLTNDVLRMSRTFCVNYEARTRREPEKEMAKRRLKNYKLKHSRLLTCYSAILYLLAIFSKNKTVSPSDAGNMISLTPTERLEWLLSQPELGDAHSSVRKLIEGYEAFLSNTDASEAELVSRFMDKGRRREYFDSAYRFGELVFEVMGAIGEKSPPFHRLLVV